MPIHVQLPDGSVGEFPDGMADADIERVLQQQFPVQAQPKASFSDVSSRVSTTATNVRPSLFRNDSDFPQRSGVAMPTRVGAVLRDMFGAGDSAASYLAEKTGGEVRHDANGSPLLRLKDGATYRLNDPGLDTTDVANVAGNAAAFFLPASWLGRLSQARSIGTGGRAALQALGSGVTDAALQAGVTGGDVDPGKVALSTIGGGIGEGVGTALGVGARKLGELGRRLSGANQQAAEQTLQNAGVQPTRSALSQLLPQMEQINAGANPNAILGQNQFGLQYTLGQRLMDPQRKFAQSSAEEVLRQSPGGGHLFREMEAHNTRQIDSALSNMGQQFGSRAATTPAEMVQGSASRLQAQADDLSRRIADAYAKAGQSNRMAIGADAVATIPQRMREAVQGFDIHPAVTPVAARTLDQVGMATQHILGSINGGNVKGVTLRALETQRRILNSNIEAASNRADRAAMVKMKIAFDGWMDDAVDTALVSGDPSALTALKEARGLRAEYGRRFEGGRESDSFIAGLLDGSKTPEELLNVALGASQVSKMGGARFIERLRVAANGDPEILGGLKAAHFARLTQGKDGAALTPGQIVRNVRSTEYSNSSVVKALYTKEEWNQVRFLAAALEPLVAKGDFARTSGTAERLMRALGVNGGSLPLVGGVLKTTQGVRDALKAERAINGRVRAPVRPLPGVSPGFVAIGSEIED